jgi:hypothetical protein
MAYKSYSSFVMHVGNDDLDDRKDGFLPKQPERPREIECG